MAHDPFQPPRAPLESPQSAQARHLRAARKYLTFAVCVGLLELGDAATLASHEGAFGAFNYLVSVIELFWLPASIWLLIRVKHPSTRLVAHAYVAYAVIGMIVGSLIGSADSVPAPVIAVGGAFGLLYAATSAYVLAFDVRRKLKEMT